ncbi:hypothetical protein MYP_3896 [Sporocytophaga myxococcoides]|uniref:Uncharacterized protein n=1 Tax=Sporocytophaga myxococcoides TaxID=153721 RepID=A0A098LI41_9BACT|nr:hypothetical protein [Sporocytophaga myxococcoides]GAL86666.1 hypothetical protein MYP_3896 [Sporocytophaga myxococcoides]
MTQLLESPKTTYLLEGSLEVLHQQTREWLSEMDLWKDEILFFKNLINKQLLKVKTEDDKEELRDYEKILSKMHNDWLEHLYMQTQAHEMYLAGIMQNRPKDYDEVYRERHRDLTEKVDGFHKEMRSIKSELFEFIEKL